MQNEKTLDILVVDDTLELLELLETILEAEGYTVRCAPSGKIALMLAANLPPDLIFMDLNMPEMDGLEACRRIKELPGCHNIPIIFISGHMSQKHINAGLEAGGIDYICKPFEIDAVLLKVRTVLGL
jgi:DNA-binding response OmpR family regulator